MYEPKKAVSKLSGREVELQRTNEMGALEEPQRGTGQSRQSCLVSWAALRCILATQLGLAADLVLGTWRSEITLTAVIIVNPEDFDSGHICV